MKSRKINLQRLNLSKKTSPATSRINFLDTNGSLNTVASFRASSSE